jgi:hypothetical protein
LEVYYFTLISQFLEAGYQILFVDDLKKIGQFQKKLHLLFENSMVTIVRKPNNSENTIFLTNVNPKLFSDLKFKSTLVVDFDYFSPKNDSNHFKLPFMLHPDAFLIKKKEDINQYRNTTRKSRILFAGNVDAYSYDNPILRTAFNVMNRFELIEFLKTNVSPSLYFEIDEINSYFEQAYNQKLVFRTFEWNSNGQRKNMHRKTAFNLWYDLISSADFWLCCPGVSMPHCHNVVEAMMLGTIPILEFDQMFEPQLEDGVNCIIFKGEQDLLQKINRILELPHNEIIKMRQNVSDYYDKHIHYQAITHKIETFENKTTILINGGFKSVELLEQSAKLDHMKTLWNLEK